MVKRSTLIPVILLCLVGGRAVAQSVPYMFIVQKQFGNDSVVVVSPTNTSPMGSSDTPTMLDLGAAFTVYVDVTKNAYSGKLLYLYMQDWTTNTGSVNGGNFQTTAQNVPALRFTGPTTPANLPNIDRYQLTIAAGSYYTLMGSPSGWNSLPDGRIIRPTFYIGSATASPIGQGTWNQFVTNNNAIDIYGYKNLLKLTRPVTDKVINVEIDQYTPISQDLETMLRNGWTAPGGTFTIPANSLPSGTYTWYLDDQYGVNPPAYTVNNPNKWFNNIYQSGFKPWINSSHVDMANPAFVSKNNANADCYTLYYYAYSGSVPSNQFVDTSTYRKTAYKVAVKIKPVGTPPLIASPITIISENYGSAAAGTTWRSTGLPSGQTNYTWESGHYLPGDGKYCMMQDIVGQIWGALVNSRPMDWYVPPGGYNAPAKKYDHTSEDGTGFMYIVNASASGGVFYKNTFSVCPSMNLQFSMWLMNICDGTRQSGSAYSNYRIKPNVHVQIWSGNITSATPPTSGTPLLDYYTGEIPMTGIWEQYFTPIFNVPAGTSQVTVFYLSVNNGGDGNDFMMDDVQIQRSNGALNFTSTDNIPCLSANDPYTLNAAWDANAMQQLYGSPVPSTFYYTWTFYANITDPGSITGAGTVPGIVSGSPVSGTASYPGTGGITLTVPGTQIGTYKLTIAATQAGLTDQCAVYSYCVFSPASPPVIQTTAQSPVCPGIPINFSINTSNILDPTQLLWYTVSRDSTTLVPLLNSAGDQVTGANIIVIPFDTTTYAVKISDCSNQLQYKIYVQKGPEVGFGTNSQTDNYMYRVGYNATTISIPIAYSAGTSGITYQVYQDGVANATQLSSGSLPGTSATGTISITPNLIKPSLDNFRKGLNTITCAVLLKDGSANTCSTVQKFKIRFIADGDIKALWAPMYNPTIPVDSFNWNNDANWYITDELGNRYAGEAGVPTASTNVVIPGDAPSYPVLSANPQPVCDSILFQFGGEVAQLQHLQYTHAFVEMNLGTYDANSSFTNMANLMNTDGGSNYYPYYLSRDRYYSMSAPLKDMYAGDFAFGGKPNVYMKYADAIPITTDSTAEMMNKWTISISSYKIPFTAGFGFAYQVYSGNLDETWPNKNNQKNLNSVSGLVRWPYYMNDAYRDTLNPRHAYNAPTSTFSYYSEGRPDSIVADIQPDAVTRQFSQINPSIPLGNRFIAENDNDVIPANYPVVTIDAKQKSSEILVGNPFMSHLSFKQFYLRNARTVGQYYRIWMGTGRYYSVSVNESGDPVASTDLADDVAGIDTLIAPMQSFFVPVLENPTEDRIYFDIEKMSITKSNKTLALRNSNGNNIREILKITAANSRYSATAVIIHKPGEKELGEGVPKLFSPSGNIPDVYLIQNYKKEILEIDETPQAIPLEIKTKVTGGVLRLTFTGLENFSSKVALKDTKTGETKTLSAADNVYSFMNNEGDQTNRFFLLLGDYTGFGNPATNLISVSAGNSRIYVKASSLDPVQSVKIYNLQGQMILGENNLSAVSYESEPVNGKGVYLVEVKTRLSNVTKKVIVY